MCTKPTITNEITCHVLQKSLQCHTPHRFNTSLLTPYHSLSSASWNLLCFITVIQTLITSQIIFCLLINCPIPGSLVICSQAPQRLPRGHPYTPCSLSHICHGHKRALRGLIPPEWGAKINAEH